MIRRPLLGAEDAEHMLRAVSQLGARVERLGEDVAIEGAGGRWAPITDGLDVRLDLGNAGTAVRFLSAASLLSPVPVIIDGDARMQQRPIGELVEVLRAIGADVRYLNAEGCPPIRIATPQGRAPAMPAALELEPTLSSQFISALLLIAPWLAVGDSPSSSSAPSPARRMLP
jgi:3-phosphoshikimate 1-carboxyvinyltransferase